MYNHILYLSYWAVNTLVIYVFSLLNGNSVVLGNYRFTPVESAIYAGFWATVLFWTMWDYVYVRRVDIDKTSGRFWVFAVMNFVSFWLVSRFSHIAGFGISSFWWAMLIGFVANIVQRLAWAIVVGRRNRKTAAIV